MKNVSTIVKKVLLGLCIYPLICFAANTTVQNDIQAACVDGKAGVYDCKNVDLLSNMSLTELGDIGRAQDSWGWKDPKTGRYYAIVSMFKGTSFVDVTDPAHPIYLGKMLSTNVDSGAASDVKTYANHAFAVSSASFSRMQVFDLTRLRDIDSPQIFEPDTVYMEFGRAHNLAINEDTGYAYLVGGGGCNGGLNIVDINTPKSPVHVNCFSSIGGVHDTQCVKYKGPDERYLGAEICFASNGPNLSIIDVTDKSNMKLLGQVSWPYVGFAHQGWLTKDQRYFLMGDEGDEPSFDLNTRTIILDVSDLEQPAYVGAHLADTTAIDHNQYIIGNYVYQANYSVGLRILHIEDLAKAELTEVAWFDTYPANNNLSDLGAWNVYPFFDNGTLLVSDATTGLFMLRSSVGPEFQINAGLNDAWFNPETNGQGFFITVFPDLGIVTMAWFTYDTELPPMDATANLGDPGHRWLTAVGAYADNQAVMNIDLTSNGIFDTPTDVQHTEPPGSDGTLILNFENCNSGTVEYDIPSIDRQGIVPIRRVVDDNIVICEALKAD